MAQMNVDFKSRASVIDENRLYGTVLGQDEKNHKATIQLSDKQVKAFNKNGIEYGQAFKVTGEYTATAPGKRDIISDATLERDPENDIKPLRGTVVGIKEHETKVGHKYDAVGIKVGEIENHFVSPVTGEEGVEIEDDIRWVNMNKPVSRGTQKGDAVVAYGREAKSGLWVDDRFGFVNESARERAAAKEADISTARDEALPKQEAKQRKDK